ncbi:MAG: hypothetical protein GY765_06410 [bacterium]|nr:hypothetical protein [bacterium]
MVSKKSRYLSLEGDQWEQLKKIAESVESLNWRQLIRDIADGQLQVRKGPPSLYKELERNHLMEMEKRKRKTGLRTANYTFDEKIQGALTELKGDGLAEEKPINPGGQMVVGYEAKTVCNHVLYEFDGNDPEVIEILKKHDLGVGDFRPV